MPAVFAFSHVMSCTLTLLCTPELAVNNTRQIPTNPLYFTYILASDERASALTSQSASVDYVCNDCLRVAGCARGNAAILRHV